jgi:general secretion pathway protein K
MSPWIVLKPRPQTALLPASLTPSFHRKTQSGAAVVMAMFVVVLCTLAISPLIWSLFSSAKTVQVAASRAQTREVALSGLDWARVILREDARVSTVDNLNEPWAVPLAESRVSEGLLRKNETESNLVDREAVLTGVIEDAASKLNLRNLGADIAGQEVWNRVFGRLCELLNIQQDQKARVLAALSQMYPKPKPQDGEAGANGLRGEQARPPIPARRWEEFQGKFGISEETWNQLKPYVTILPEVSPVNANTASAEVLYSVIDGIQYSDAQALLNSRERVTFREIGDIQAALNGSATLNNALITTKSNYFLVQGTAQVDEAVVRTQALLQRKDNRVYVLWRR